MPTPLKPLTSVSSLLSRKAHARSQRACSAPDADEPADERGDLGGRYGATRAVQASMPCLGGCYGRPRRGRGPEAQFLHSPRLTSQTQPYLLQGIFNFNHRARNFNHRARNWYIYTAESVDREGGSVGASSASVGDAPFTEVVKIPHVTTTMETGRCGYENHGGSEAWLWTPC
jgi:hypothetical protein